MLPPMTDWTTYSKIEVGDVVKSPGSSWVWASRKQAETSESPWREVVAVERVGRAIILRFADGEAFSNRAQAKVLRQGAQ